MMKMLKIISVLLMALLLAGCMGEKVEVGSAEVGKVMTKNGYKESVITTSKFRLEPCLAYCDKLVTLDISDQAVREPITVFMPEDKLEISFDLRMTIAVDSSEYESLFNRIKPVKDESGDKISIAKAYEVYAKQIIRTEARSFVTKYSIADLMSNREAINAELSKIITKRIREQTPFTVRYVGLADIGYPDIIVKAQERSAERREAIRQEEAQLEVSKVQLERKLQEQRMKRNIDVEKAEAEKQVNLILAESMTPEYLQYRSMNIMEKLAESDNKVVVPMGMLDSLSGQVALGNEMSR